MKGTPTYDSKYEFVPEPWQADILRARERVAVSIYCACLVLCRKIINILRSDEEYSNLAHKEDKSAEDRKRLSEIRTSSGFTKYAVSSFANKVRHHFKNRKKFRHGQRNQSAIEGPIAQNLGERAFRAAEKLLYGKAEKLRFHRLGDPFMMEGKDNNHAIMLKGMTIFWNGLVMSLLPIDDENAYLKKTFDDPVKYCGIKREIIRGKERWYLHVRREGIPPIEYKKNPDFTGEGVVGLDIGTSTIAECGEECVALHELSPGCQKDEAEIRRLKRKLDRSRRANNPHNYNADGTLRKAVKGGRLKWFNSNTYKRTRSRIRELDRKTSAKRKMEHNILSKTILSHGHEFVVENMSFKGLQKRAEKTTRNRKNGRYNRKSRFGRAIANRSPSTLLETLERKHGYYGRSLIRADTWKVKASQYCHLTGRCVKKQLYERWNVFDGKRVQRDLYSAFLLMNVSASLDAVDRDSCDRNYGKFLLMHDEEVKRLRELPKENILRWYVR